MNSQLAPIDEVAPPTPEPPQDTGPDPRERPAKTRKSERWDVGLASIMISAGVLGLRLVNDSTLWDRFLSGRTAGSIGVVTRQAGAVRLKASRSLVWRELPDGQQAVAAGDTLYTGTGGVASLKANDGSIARIAPNTLVILGVEEDKTRGWLGDLLLPRFRGAMNEGALSLNLTQGSVTVEMKQKGSAVAVHSGRKNLVVRSEQDGGDFEVSADNDGSSGAPELHVTNLKRTPLQVEQDGTSTRASAPFAHLLAPIDGERLLVPGVDDSKPSSIPVRFTWGAVAAGSGGATLEVKGARSLLAPVDLSSGYAEVPLVPGHYRWRLVSSSPSARAAVEGNTQWRELTLLPLAPPPLLGPPDNASLATDSRSSAWVLWSWGTLPEGLTAQVQLVPDTRGSASEMLEGDRSGAGRILRLGTYRWRVRAVADAGQFSSWSPWRTLEIGQATPARPPVPPPPVVEVTGLRVDADNQTPANDSYDAIPVEVSWTPVSGAKGYRVLLTDPRQADKPRVGQTQQPQYVFELKSRQDTPLEVKVEALLEGNRSASSAPVPFSIRYLPPEPMQPMQGESVKRRSAILVTWKRTTLTEEYRIQFARDPAFKSIIADKKTRKNWQAFVPTRATAYYWRVKSLGTGTETRWSSPRKFLSK